MEDKIASLERRLETLREEEASEGAAVTLAASAAPARKLREPGSFDGRKRTRRSFRCLLTSIDGATRRKPFTSQQVSRDLQWQY